MTDENLPIQEKIRQIMFKYRATPLRDGETPSEKYLGRQIRTRLDALRPTKINMSTITITSARRLSVGDSVQARYYTANTPLWKLGVIEKKFGQLHYMV